MTHSRVSLKDISFEPLDKDDPYVKAILRWADGDAEITFGWRIFVRGGPFGICWVEMYGPYGLIHGLTAVRGRYTPMVSISAFRLCESAVKSLGLEPAVMYPKEYLHVKRLCDSVGYRSIPIDSDTNFATASVITAR